MGKTRLLCVVLGAVAVAACGGYPVPTDKMVAAEAAVRGAQEVGAANEPKAALHLKLAQEQVQKAKSLMESGDNKRAEYTLLRATADAELALALAKSASVKAEAQTALDQVKSLQKGP